MNWLVLALVLSEAPTDTELDEARRACEKRVGACARYQVLKDTAKDAVDAEGERQYRARQAAAEKLRADALEAIAIEERAEEALKRKCGKDYRRVRVGMTFKRLRECTGDVFDLVAEDQRGAVYEAPAGTVRIEGGVVVKWIAR